MAETMQTLEELSALKPAAAPEAPKYVQKLDKQGRAYATGKRKDAVARVWIKPGAGKIIVNDRPVEIYFARPVLRMMIQQPLVAANRAGPVRRGLHRVRRRAVRPGRRGAPRPLQGADLYEPDLRAVLKQGGFLTRDPRVVERKKYGRAKARRSFQFSKR